MVLLDVVLLSYYDQLVHRRVCNGKDGNFVKLEI